MKRPSPALVISLLALFVALGGTSYAVTTLPKSSVGREQIKKGAVTRMKISRATRKALRGHRGRRGAAGAQGAPGPAGPAGAPAAKLFAVVGADGKLVRGSGATSAEKLGVGAYDVEFNANIVNCVPLATVGSDQDIFPPGAISVTRFGTNGLTVRAGPTVDNAEFDEAFNVVVFC